MGAKEIPLRIARQLYKVIDEAIAFHQSIG